MNILLQYFTHTDTIRNSEITYCTKHNTKNKKFDKVTILLEKSSDYQTWMEGCIIYNFQKRPTFKDIVEYTNTLEDDIFILPNSDIFFDDSISLVNQMNDKDFITLTRWNIDVNTKNASLFNINCSQDVWIWKGKVDTNDMNINWYMGLPGIDNLICGAFHEKGYKVLNPAMIVKSYHLHQDIKRSYSDKDVVRGRLYILYTTNNFTESKIAFWKDTTNI